MLRIWNKGFSRYKVPIFQLRVEIQCKFCIVKILLEYVENQRKVEPEKYKRLMAEKEVISVKSRLNIFGKLSKQKGIEDTIC